MSKQPIETNPHRQNIEHLLTSNGVSSLYIKRSLKLYEKQYGYDYNTEIISELIYRLKVKDKLKKQKKIQNIFKSRKTTKNILLSMDFHSEYVEYGLNKYDENKSKALHHYNIEILTEIIMNLRANKNNKSKLNDHPQQKYSVTKMVQSNDNQKYYYHKIIPINSPQNKYKENYNDNQQNDIEFDENVANNLNKEQITCLIHGYCKKYDKTNNNAASLVEMFYIYNNRIRTGMYLSYTMFTNLLENGIHLSPPTTFKYCQQNESFEKLDRLTKNDHMVIIVTLLTILLVILTCFNFMFIKNDSFGVIVWCFSHLGCMFCCCVSPVSGPCPWRNIIKKLFYGSPLNIIYFNESNKMVQNIILKKCKINEYGSLSFNKSIYVCTILEITNLSSFSNLKEIVINPNSGNIQFIKYMDQNKYISCNDHTYELTRKLEQITKNIRYLNTVQITDIPYTVSESSVDLYNDYDAC